MWKLTHEASDERTENREDENPALSPAASQEPLLASLWCRQHAVKFVLQSHSLLTQDVEDLIRSRLHPRLNALHFVISLVILIEQPPKVTVVHFQVVDSLPKLRKLVYKIMFLHIA